MNVKRKNNLIVSYLIVSYLKKIKNLKMSESKLNYDEKINETDKLNFIKEEKISEKVYYKIIKLLI